MTVIRVPDTGGTANGAGAVRCMYMTGGAMLIGFTLTNGATGTNWATSNAGGGVYCESQNEVVSNCFLVGNSASSGGGGARAGKLIDCILSGNLAVWEGGGAAGSILNHCTITNNQGNGGGAIGGSLTNCLLADNSASNGVAGHAGC